MDDQTKPGPVVIFYRPVARAIWTLDEATVRKNHPKGCKLDLTKVGELDFVPKCRN